MAKVTDLNEVYAEALSQLNSMAWTVVEYIGTNNSALAVTNIYMMGDQTRGYGQDFTDGLSIISSPTRISVIHNGSASMYRQADGICGYEDLADDVQAILVTLEAAIQRMIANEG